MTLPWYPRDMGKYARDTGTLSLAQHGAYNLLLDYYYSTGPINAFEQCSSNAQLMPDHSGIYRLCKATTKPEQEAVDFILKKYFWLDEAGFYRHTKCDEVIDAQQKKRATRVRVGKENRAKALLKQCSSNALQNQNQIKTKKDKIKKGDLSDEISEDDFIRENFDIGKVLTEGALQEARAAAPGHDIYALIGTFNEGVRSRKLTIPDKPDKAFPKWCKAFTKGKKP